MGHRDLKIAPSPEMALILLQKDDREFLPAKPFAEGAATDLSLFASPVHEQFRETIAGNAELSKEWEQKVAPLFARNDLNGQEDYSLRLGALLLQAFANPEKTPPLPRSAREFPPGLPTANTIGSALLMFLPDAAESIIGIRPEDVERLDISRLAPGHPANEKFIKILEQNNPGLISDWNEKVIRAAEFMRTHWAKEMKGNRGELNLRNVIQSYDDPVARGEIENYATFLFWGNAILQCLESDERPWAGGGNFEERGRKIVLGGMEFGEISEISPLWFDLFAQRLNLPDAVGEKIYGHLLNGGLEGNDRVSLREIAQFGEIGGERKGFFTRNFFGLSEGGKRVLAETLETIRKESLFVEYRYSDRDEKTDLSLFIDPETPFIEITATNADGTLWILRSPVPSEKAGSFEKSVVIRQEGVSLEGVRHLLFLVKKSLRGYPDRRAHLEAFEGLISL